ncbi:MAG: hypothetical protein ACLFVF_07610 [Thiohalospira sp.]
MENKEEAEEKTKQLDIIVGGCVKAFRTLINASVYVLLFYFIYLSINSLAGKETDANIALLADLSTGCSKLLLALTILSVLLATFGILYGRKQERLKKDVIRDLSEYRTKYEQILDPERTSSNLANNGDTRPEDKP